jgi:alpha-1,2-mannosyltransferase
MASRSRTSDTVSAPENGINVVFGESRLIAAQFDHISDLFIFITAVIRDAGCMGIPQAQTSARAQPANRHWPWVIAVAAIAFVIRLVPVLRGGGLFGLGNYDDGVYYAAGTGIAHGLLPYRDFLFLHPPGVPLLLTPFALIAQLTTDSYGFAFARVAWMLLGALNAVLIWRILRPIGLVAAVFGALSYAVFYPAVYADKSTLLESPATTALLLAIILLEPLGKAGSLSRNKALAAGALLGLTIGIKAWGIITVLIVLGWLLLSRRFRVALHVTIGAAAIAGLICLPFFAAAPTAMWNQIVRDQAIRQANDGPAILTRLSDIAGLGISSGDPHVVITVVAAAALLCCAVLAWSYQETQLATLLVLGQGASLLIAPIWFPHYASFTAAPIALTVGAAIGRLITVVGAKPARIAVGVILACALLVYSSGWSDIRFGHRFPDRFTSVTTPASGCVTADDPVTLIETNTLSRNLSRGCALVVDLGGHSHDMAADMAATSGVLVSRIKNEPFQRFALGYLSSGSVTILVRFSRGQGFSAQTAAVLDQWPLLARSGRYQIRQPVALSQSATRGLPKPQRR